MQTVAIVGVGLIGGSFALAIRKAGFAGRIVGVSSPQTLAKAVSAGVVDTGASLEEAAAQADLIYLSQPINGILRTLERLSGIIRPGTLVTDAGSTKQEIVHRAMQFLPADSFLGGHPMAGKASSGLDHADAGPAQRVAVRVGPQTSDIRLKGNQIQGFAKDVEQ